jgi:UDP-2,3-diacylglucosamine pyrophosphatase LpxH
MRAGWRCSGTTAYTLVLWLNRHFNTMRRHLGYLYWSLSAYLKRRVKNAVQYIASFGVAIADEARRPKSPCRHGASGR